MNRAQTFFGRRFCWVASCLILASAFLLPSTAFAEILSPDHSVFDDAVHVSLADNSPAATVTDTTATPDTIDESDEGQPPTEADTPSGESIAAPVDSDSGLVSPLLETDGSLMMFMLVGRRNYTEHYNWGSDGRVGRQGWGWNEVPGVGGPWYTFKVGGSTDGIKLAPVGGGKTYVNKEKILGGSDPNAPGSHVVFNSPGTTRVHQADFRGLATFSDSHCQGLRVALYGEDPKRGGVGIVGGLIGEGMLKSDSLQSLVDNQYIATSAQVWLWTYPCPRGAVVIPTPNNSFGQVKSVDITLADQDLPVVRLSDNLTASNNAWINRMSSVTGELRAVDPGSGIAKVTRVMNGPGGRVVLPRHSVPCDEFHRAQTEIAATCPFDRTFPTTIPFAAMKDGTNEITFTAYDRSGHQSLPTKLTFNIDRQPPTARFTPQTVRDLSEGWHSDREHNVQAALEVEDKASGIDHIRVLSQKNGQSTVLFDRGFCEGVLKTKQCPDKAQPTITIPTDKLLDGEQLLIIEATDKAGNTHRSQPLPYKHDRVSPTKPSSVKVTTKTRGTARVTWRGSYDPLPGSGIDHYRYHLQDRGWQETTTSTITVDGLFPGKTYGLELQAVDKAGNVSESERVEWAMPMRMQGRVTANDGGSGGCDKKPLPEYCKKSDLKQCHKHGKKYLKIAREFFDVVRSKKGHSEDVPKALIEDWLQAAKGRRGVARSLRKAAYNYFRKHTFVWSVDYKAQLNNFSATTTKQQNANKAVGNRMSLIYAKQGEFDNENFHLNVYCDLNHRNQLKQKSRADGKAQKLYGQITKRYRQVVAAIKEINKEVKKKRREAFRYRRFGLLSLQSEEMATEYLPKLMLAEGERFWPVDFGRAIEGFERRGDGHQRTCIKNLNDMGGDCLEDAYVSLLQPNTGNGQALDYPAAADSTRKQEEMARRVFPHYGDGATVYFFRGYGKKEDGKKAGGYVSAQYWWYYTYNFIKSPEGDVGQHEGDFEHVALILSRRSGKLRYIYTARHNNKDKAAKSKTPYRFFSNNWKIKSLGQCKPLDKKTICVEHGLGVDYHPVIYSAYGSHASYPSCGKYYRRIFGGDFSDYTCRGRAQQFPTAGKALQIMPLPRLSWACWQGRMGEGGVTPIADGREGIGAPLAQYKDYYITGKPKINPCDRQYRAPNRIPVRKPSRRTSRRGKSSLSLSSQSKGEHMLGDDLVVESGSLPEDPQLDRLEQEILDESELSSETVSEMEASSFPYQELFGDCSQWQQPVDEGAQLVACNQKTLDKFVDSGLETVPVDSPRIISPNQPQTSVDDGIAIPAVGNADSVQELSKLKIIAKQATKTDIYASAQIGDERETVLFNDVPVVPSKSLELDTTNDQQWVLRDQNGQVVADKKPDTASIPTQSESAPTLQPENPSDQRAEPLNDGSNSNGDPTSSDDGTSSIDESSPTSTTLGTPILAPTNLRISKRRLRGNAYLRWRYPLSPSSGSPGLRFEVRGYLKKNDPSQFVVLKTVSAVSQQAMYRIKLPWRKIKDLKMVTVIARSAEEAVPSINVEVR